MIPFDAIVLAGGRARRLAGADKPAELVGGRRLIDIALDAVAGAGRIVVVGPARNLPPHVESTRESPPYAGPVAALAAGLATLRDDDRGEHPVAVLASDLPEVTGELVGTLLAEHARTRAPAVFAVDESGRSQYLLGVWSRRALAAALTAAPGSSMRRLVPDHAAYVAAPGTADVDTPDDLSTARQRAARPLLDPIAARTILRDELTAVPPRPVGLADAAGTVLAGPLIAARPFPPFDASAMDGYAVAGDEPWAVLNGARPAGHTDPLRLLPGQAVTIATGAALPDGATRCIRHEDTLAGGGLLTTTGDGAARDDTRRRGSAWRSGTVLAPAGLAVDAAVRSVALAAGVGELAVRGPVRARLYTSGDEIVAELPPGAPLPDGAVPDTASPAVAEILAQRGLAVSSGGHLDDAPAAFAAALSTPAADIVVVIGATGHGVADHLRTALVTAGAQIVIDGLALRPGGSLIVARLPGGAVLLGLGGNPLAAVAGAAVLAPAIVDALLARTPRAIEVLDVVDGDAVRLPGRWRVLPAEPDGTGRWILTRGLGTGHLASAIGYRALVLVPPKELTGAYQRL